MDEIKNKIRSGVSILGNGKSISNLTKDQITLINSSPIFRCNWFYLDNSLIKSNIDGWFHNIPGGCNELLEKFNNSNRNVEYIFAPYISEDHIKRLNKKKYKFITSWDISRKMSIVSKKHLKSIKERGKLNLPTTGINMFHFICLLNPSVVYVSGIDMYRQNSEENSDFSKHKFDNPYKMGCKPHDLKTDIMFIIDACIHVQFKSKLRIFHCTFLQNIIDEIFDELTPSKIRKHRNDYEYIKSLANIVYNKVNLENEKM